MFCSKVRASSCEKYSECGRSELVDSSMVEMLRGFKGSISSAGDSLKLNEMYGRASGYIEALYDAGLVEGNEAADYLEGVIALYRQVAFLLT